VETRTYTVRNADGKAKTLILQHPVRQGWKLTGEPKPEETTAANYRFRVALPAQQTTKLAVNEEFEISNTTALNNLNSDLLATYVRNKALSPEAQKKLEDLIALKDRLAEATQKVTATQTEVNELRGDQDRLRQNINNLRGLPGQEAQVTRYAAKLADQEKVVEALQATLSAARASVRQLQAAVDQALRTLEI
jgi:chromosome segregation ATPase